MARTDAALIAQVAYRHFLFGEKIPDIARDLGIGKSKVYSLIEIIKAENLVSYQVHDSIAESHHALAPVLGNHLRRYGVRRVEILPGPPDDQHWSSPAQRQILWSLLGERTARLLEATPLSDGDHVCIGGGRIMTHFALSFRSTSTPLVFRPLTAGGTWRATGRVDATSVLHLLNLRHSFASAGSMVLRPSLPPQADAADPIARLLFSEEHRPAVTLCGLGRRRYRPSTTPHVHPETSSYVRLYASALDSAKPHRHSPTMTDLHTPLGDRACAQANLELEEKGIIGQICRHGFNTSGIVVPSRLEQISYTVTPQTLAQWRHNGTETILATGGGDRASALHSVLIGKHFSTLVIDTALAVQLLPRDLRPKAYRDIPAHTKGG